MSKIKNNKKIFILSLVISITIFLVITSIMFWLSLKPTNTDPIYKEVSYGTWFNEENTAHQHYNSFMVDESSRSILVDSQEKGVYLIKGSSQSILHLTDVDDHGGYSSTLLNSLNGFNGTIDITFGSISTEPKGLNIGLWAVLAISSTGCMFISIYIIKLLVKRGVQNETRSAKVKKNK